MVHNLADYHVPVNADVHGLEVIFVDEINPLGVKGVGEIGIVGTAAAIANADLPRHRQSACATYRSPSISCWIKRSQGVSLAARLRRRITGLPAASASASVANVAEEVRTTIPSL